MLGEGARKGGREFQGAEAVTFWDHLVFLLGDKLEHEFGRELARDSLDLLDRRQGLAEAFQL
jgi:hypothetical protein